MTAHKAQGKTLPACVVNLTGCKGSESPYVMLSRATSLDGVVILTPFAHERIACRQNEDLRQEFRRLAYLALQTVVEHGTEEEASRAKRELESSFNRPIADVGPTENDPCDRVMQIERANAVLTAPIQVARARIPLDTPIAAAAPSSIRPMATTKRRRPLDARPPSPGPSASKRRKS
ncbi:hypothetical protein B0H16DRAFT_1428303 [Mycena metata]|uniref:UvrD-like helicase C-terminal domain-containing protein n=1 Tax=Mycena metata TaxID=1033252 RepID=A0AAD7MRS6_9AGAR|nr:hypothetical protein B0H16DRAFT_1428303 [Mycena metata]